MKSNDLKKWIAGGLALAVFLFLGFRVLSVKQSNLLLIQKAAIKSPDFSFKDQSGRLFSSDELKGKVWVADFIFTSCAGTCPLLSQQMRLLQEKWKGNPRFKLVSFTVDPERDTVKALNKYASDLQADENQWVFLTGAKKDLYKVDREGFKVTAEVNPQPIPGFEFIHTTIMVLVDRNGLIRGYYDGSMEDEMKKLNQDVKFLMGWGG
ncbi:MAG TPA: SCO family protein [bacterium]